MLCPFCKSDDLKEVQERCPHNEYILTQCCESCGGSFEVIQEPQEILLKDALNATSKFKSAKEHTLAKGMKGMLIAQDTFRVKADNEDGFIDYVIRIDDMEIVIDDEDAFIKPSGSDDNLRGGALDYSNQTLGLPHE